MKKLLILILFACLIEGAQAQTFSEWFRQKKTQKKYLIQQIAALKLYLGYVNKGYSIVQKGLTSIGDLKDGELNLHTDYLNSLKNVNPKIKSYTRLGKIIALQRTIFQNYEHIYSDLKQSTAFNTEEMNYIHRVHNRLLDDCSEVIDELITLTTNGKLEMTDQERLKRIDELYVRMQDNYSFAKSFGNEVILLAATRKHEGSDIQTSRRMYGLKN
ncbi:hypothetical protein [Rubrolithibacter danxiaensis]|uniref:hypothetical protein n=1 Tax=Rubrolithibacter danxiaensis TaxID=3390805 RepID=UPI003BF7A3B4